MNANLKPKTALEVSVDKSKIKDLSPIEKDALIEAQMDTINRLLRENTEMQKSNAALSLTLAIGRK